MSYAGKKTAACSMQPQFCVDLTLLFIEGGNVLEHFQRCVIFALMDQELGRFLEVEHDESKKKRKKGYRAAKKRKYVNRAVGSHVDCLLTQA